MLTCDKVTDHDLKFVQACQKTNYIPIKYYDIASAGTEEMRIDTDGTPYVFYTGAGERELKVYLNCNPSVTTTEISTTGDMKEILRYVSYWSEQTGHDYYNIIIAV